MTANTPPESAEDPVSPRDATPSARLLPEQSSVTPHGDLQSWRKAIDADLKRTVAEKCVASKHGELPQLAHYPLQTLERELAALALGEDWSHETLAFFQPPDNVPAAADADLACNVARLAKSLGKPAGTVGDAIARRLQAHALVRSASVSGPFVNLQLKRIDYAEKVLDSVRALGDRYGHFNAGRGAVVVFDYSHPNIAKNMTVGHLRSTLIGHVLTKLYAAGGYVPVSINYLGDWGTQFGKLIYEYRQAEASDDGSLAVQLANDPIGTLTNLYRSFVAREEEDLPAVDEARTNFLKLEQGDPEITNLWRRFREWSLQAFQPVYDRLDIAFDSFQGESSFADAALTAVQEGIDQGVLVRNTDGAVVFPQQTVPSARGKGLEMKKDEILLKPSGGTVYLSRDLAAIKYRARELGAARVIYVVGKEQEMHCAILFAIAEKLRYIEAGQAQHVAFGHLTIDGVKMGTRKGRVQLMTDILDDAIERAKRIMMERTGQKDLSAEQQEVARTVAVCSLFFNDLRQGRERDIEFNPEKSVVVVAGQGPYIQYTYARINSILREAGPAEPTATSNLPSMAPTEASLVMHLSFFPAAVQAALSDNGPHVLATYLDKLCKLINTFYHDLPVLKAGESERRFRIALLRACQQVVSNAANLLHLSLPERM